MACPETEADGIVSGTWEEMEWQLLPFSTGSG